MLVLARLHQNQVAQRQNPEWKLRDASLDSYRNGITFSLQGGIFFRLKGRLGLSLRQFEFLLNRWVRSLHAAYIESRVAVVIRCIHVGAILQKEPFRDDQ